MPLRLFALVLTLGAATAHAQVDDPEELDPPEAEEESVVEGGGVVVVEQAPVPPGYGEQPLTPVPQPDPTPMPAGDPQYGQGYAPQPTYQQPPRYHREPYVEGLPLPPNAQIETRARKGLLIPGIGMFAGGYISMVFTYAFADSLGGDPPGTMLVPLLGPFFLMPDAEAGGRLLLAIDGLLQIGGLTLFILGLTLKQKFVTWYGDSRIRVTPVASRRGGSLALSGVF